MHLFEFYDWTYRIATSNDNRSIKPAGHTPDNWNSHPGFRLDTISRSYLSAICRFKRKLSIYMILKSFPFIPQTIFNTNNCTSSAINKLTKVSAKNTT